MNIRLKCSECGEIADYDKGKMYPLNKLWQLCSPSVPHPC
jgi:hypothetical protein